MIHFLVSIYKLHTTTNSIPFSSIYSYYSFDMGYINRQFGIQPKHILTNIKLKFPSATCTIQEICKEYLNGRTQVEALLNCFYFKASTNESIPLCTWYNIGTVFKIAYEWFTCLQRYIIGQLWNPLLSSVKNGYGKRCISGDIDAQWFLCSPISVELSVDCQPDLSPRKAMLEKMRKELYENNDVNRF
jgi:hypothetical protein